MGVALAGGFALVTGLQLGRSLANLLAGAGWTWPDPTTTSGAGRFNSPIGTAFWTSLPGVLTGDSSAGLAQQEASNGRLAGPSLTWGCLVVTELLVVVALGWLAIFVLQRWGPGRMRGMATSAEAERMLGVTRLRKVAGIVRPGPARQARRRRIHDVSRCGGRPRPAHTRRRGRATRAAARPRAEPVAGSRPRNQGEAMNEKASCPTPLPLEVAS